MFVYLKNYLPTHSTFRPKKRMFLCIFADAIRKGRAEAKQSYSEKRNAGFDAIRKGRAEAKLARENGSPEMVGRNP